MAKKESTFFNMVLTLLVITLVASSALGYIYELTKEPIARAKLAKKVTALQTVLPEFDNNPVEDMYEVDLKDAEEKLEFYPAVRGGDKIGTAVRTFSKKGFGGIIWLMVGFDESGNILDVSVLEHKETPGLGTKMDDDKFKEQFRGKNPEEFNLEVKKDGGEVDAITAATISSRAFSDGVQRAYDALQEGGQSE